MTYRLLKQAGPALACPGSISLRFLAMRMEWSAEDLVGSWTLVDEDWRLVGNKAGPTRLGFSLLLKFFELEARFPTSAKDLPEAAVAHVAGQVKVEPADLAGYSWDGRSIKYHRAQIRSAFGFREFIRGDEDKLAAWLVLTATLSEDQLVIEREDGRKVGSAVLAVRVRRHCAEERPARVRPA